MVDCACTHYHPKLTHEKWVLLRSIDRELTHTLIAAEVWHPNYTRDPKLFKRLVAAETTMQQELMQYFKDFSRRIPYFINWQEVHRRISGSADVTVSITDSNWKGEQQTLISLLTDPISEAALVGGLLTEQQLGIDIGYGAGNASLLKAVREHTMDTVTGINQTTKDQLRQKLLQGLDAGMTHQEITDSIATLIDNPVRAFTIARTEAVRATTMGTLDIGRQAGAQIKVWEDGQAGECAECLAIDPKRIPFEDQFSDGSDGPPAHPRCLCGLSVDFATPDDLANMGIGPDDAAQPDLNQPTEEDVIAEGSTITLTQGKKSLDLSLTGFETKFLADSGVSINAGNPVKKRNVYGYYRPLDKSVNLVKIDGEHPERTVFHELGHAIDYNINDYSTGPAQYSSIEHRTASYNDPEAIAAIKADRDAVVVTRVKQTYGPNLSLETIARLVKGLPIDEKLTVSPAMRKYLYDPKEVYADGYVQWRTDPALFAEYAPNLSDYYKNL